MAGGQFPYQQACTKTDAGLNGWPRRPTIKGAPILGCIATATTPAARSGDAPRVRHDVTDGGRHLGALDRLVKQVLEVVQLQEKEQR